MGKEEPEICQGAAGAPPVAAELLTASSRTVAAVCNHRPDRDHFHRSHRAPCPRSGLTRTRPKPNTDGAFKHHLSHGVLTSHDPVVCPDLEGFNLSLEELAALVAATRACVWAAPEVPGCPVIPLI